MTEASEALAVKDLHVHYGKREVLRGLNLQLDRGEIYGLLGPNGAGKTTLIRTICGRIRLRNGSVRIAGQPARRQLLRQIGLVPQELGLYPHLTIRENLQVFGRLSGLKRADTRDAVVWASHACDLVRRLDEPVEVLSGGWKRRVNIAASILHRPVLLILDEPTVGVDVDARNGLHDVIKELSRAGMGVLLTTHDLDQAETICSTVGFLRNGIVDPQGAPRALISQAYRDDKEVILELRQPVSEIQSKALYRAGFVPMTGAMNWTMRGGIEDEAIGRLSAALAQAGIVTREIRVRQPGLDSLFVLLSRENAGTALQ